MTCWFTPQWVEALATLVYAGVTIAVCFLMWCQSKKMKAQLEEMRAAREQTEQMLGITNRAADAAQKSADALVNSERAFITAEIVAEQEKPALYDLRVQNFGRTPGLIMGVRYGWTSLDRNDAIPRTLENPSVPKAFTHLLSNVEPKPYVLIQGMLCPDDNVPLCHR